MDNEDKEIKEGVLDKPDADNEVPDDEKDDKDAD